MSIASSTSSSTGCTTSMTSQPPMELGMNPDNLVWNDTEYKLKFILDNPNFDLPQVVRIHQGHMIDEDDALASGQILTIHGKKKIENISGCDIYGKELNIPISCPFKLRILSLGSPRKFKNVQELCSTDSPPKCVLFSNDTLVSSTIATSPNDDDSTTLDPDVVLELKDNVLTSDGDIAGINCQVSNNDNTAHRTVTLPMHFVGSFVETLSKKQCEKRYLVADLVKEFNLPLNIQFLSTSEKNSAYGPHLGAITLEKRKAINSVLATTIIDNVRHALTFSADLPVTVQVATGIKKSPYSYPSSNTAPASVSSTHAASQVDLKRFDYCSPSDPYSGVTLQTFDDLCTPMLPRRGSQLHQRRGSGESRTRSVDNDYHRSSSRYRSASSVSDFSNAYYNNSNSSKFQSNSSLISSNNGNNNKNNKGHNKSKDLSKNIENFFKFRGLRKSMSSKLGRDRSSFNASSQSQRKQNMQDADYLDEERSFIQSDDGNSSAADLFSIAPTSNGSDSTCNESTYSRMTECIDSISIADHHHTTTMTPDRRRRRHMRKGSGDSGICVSGRKHHSRSRSLSRSRSSRMSPDDAPSSSNPSDTIDTFSEWSLPKDSPSSGRKTYSSSQGRRSSSGFLWGVEPTNTTDEHEMKRSVTTTSEDFVSQQNTLNNTRTFNNQTAGPESKEFNKNNKDNVGVPTTSPLTSRQKDSMNQIQQLNEDGVCRILDQLKFNDFKDAFIQNQVNGQLLLELEVEDLVNDLKLSLFQAKKITKYIKGWRPETENHQITEASRRNSLNPRDWSENDVLLHMTTINLSEFGQFCIKNQVNGDLLMDILDKDTLNSLKDDHKLKITNLESKKLLNFVVKGWRPDISPKKSALL